ncbi:MAG: FG-GAP repeat domain-containing protein, partial [Gemmataceae bacterium]
MASGWRSSSWHWLKNLKRPWGNRPVRRQRPVSVPLRLEELEVRLAPAIDFGDAPLPYPVLTSEMGPQHVIGTLTLGATITAESNGIPSDTANSDGGDDGVVFGTVQVGAQNATVTVNVQGADGKLDTWIDFNGDGSWAGPGEHIFDSVAVHTGDNVLTFDVPAEALAGTTFARFRLSTAGGLGVGGVALDGEVEDYQVSIVAPPSGNSGILADSGQSLGNNGTWDVILADIDGDGDVDLLVGNAGASNARKANRIYFNDGTGTFTDSGQALDTDDTYGIAVG